nr:uncharacterized protein LOC109165810 [Ipomoea trifida]
MVSELADEEAMPLPAPASHAKLRRIRLQQQIRRGSLLRRGVTRSKQFSKDRSAALFLQSSQSSVSWSRSVKVLSEVLTSPPSSVVNRTSWSRSVNRSSAELVIPLFDLVSLSKVLVSSQFTIFIWSRSAKISIVNRIKVLVNVVFAVFDRDSGSRSLEFVNQPSVVDSAYVGRSLAIQNSAISDNSSDEIEDEVESLDDGDDEMLKAVNKVRRRRFIVAYEDKDDVSESCAAWGSDFKLVMKPYQKKSDIEFDIPDFGKMSPEAQQDIWSSQTRLASIKKELREVKRKSEEKNNLKFSYASHKTVTEYKEAKALGVGAVPILVGPVLYLLMEELCRLMSQLDLKADFSEFSQLILSRLAIGDLAEYCDGILSTASSVWFLDTSIEEQQRFDLVICLISSSVDEMLSQGSLAIEVIELTKVEFECSHGYK